MIEPSYIFTRDCQGDVLKYCTATNMKNVGDLDPQCILALEAGTKSGVLSPNCAARMGHCGREDDWPTTNASASGGIGRLVEIDCEHGHEGKRKRYCLLVDGFLGEWGEEDDSQCDKQCLVSLLFVFVFGCLFGLVGKGMWLVTERTRVRNTK